MQASVQWMNLPIFLLHRSGPQRVQLVVRLNIGDRGSANSFQNYMLLIQNWYKLLLFARITKLLSTPKVLFTSYHPNIAIQFNPIHLHCWMPAKAKSILCGTDFKDSITKRWSSDREQQALPQSLESAPPGFSTSCFFYFSPLCFTPLCFFAPSKLFQFCTLPMVVYHA